jgi:hypothetical protein
MKHFLVALLCVLVGFSTGLFLSEIVIAPYFSGAEILAPRNGLIVW